MRGLARCGARPADTFAAASSIIFRNATLSPPLFLPGPSGPSTQSKLCARGSTLSFSTHSHSFCKISVLRSQLKRLQLASPAPSITSLRYFAATTARMGSTNFVVDPKWTAPVVRDTFIQYFVAKNHTFGELNNCPVAFTTSDSHVTQSRPLQ
jgi:hypothetical protein